MNSLERIKKAIKREKCDRVPFGFCDQEFAVKLLGVKYSDYVSKGEIMAKVLLNIIDKYDVDWVWIHGDDWIEVENLGHKIEMSEINPPTVKEYPSIKNAKDINKLKIPNPLSDGRMPVRLEAIQILSDKRRDKMICGHIAAPFSMALLIGGIENCLIYLHENPALFKDLMEFSLENGINYAKAQIQAGAHAIWVGDVLASSWVISLEHYIKWALPFEKKIIEEIKKFGGITFLQLAENNKERFTKMMEVNSDILNIGPEADIKDILNVTRKEKCLYGGLDPINIIQRGSKEEIERKVKYCIDATEGKGYILGAGESIPRDTPIENYEIVINSLRKIARVSENES